MQFKVFCYIHAIAQTIFFIYIIPNYLAPLFWPRNFADYSAWGYVLAAINHEIFFILVNFGYFILYKFRFPFLEKYKIEDEKWPWEEDFTAWKSQLKRILRSLAINHFVVIPILTCIMIMNKKLPFRVSYETLPSSQEVLVQYIFAFIINDFCFYLLHYLFHQQFFYNYIHKIHHEIKVTFSLASEYAHPIEFLIGNVFAFNVGNLILKERMHLFTSLLITTITIFRSSETHSGYCFPWSPQYILSHHLGFLTKPDFHSFHHLKYKGNYASGIIWDKFLSNTINPIYVEYRKKQYYNK